MSITVTLPDERHAQLIQLRNALGHATFSATIRDLMAAFRDLHQIPHSIPGLEVQKCSDGLALNFDGRLIAMRTDRALAIAAALRGYLAEVRTGDFKMIWISGADEHGYLVKGAGRAGVRLMIDDAERILTHDVAEEFADVLERAARHQ